MRPESAEGEEALLARNRELEIRVAVLEARLGMLKKGLGAGASAEFFKGRNWSGWTADAFIDELYAYIDWYNSGRLKAFKAEGKVVYNTIDVRRRRLGLAA